MTTRRVIRIEVTDQSDDLEDHFTGPREREHATLVWEFPLGIGGAPPADVVSLIRGWLDAECTCGNPDLTPTEREADRNARGGS
jgi:hypothetical protein